MTEPTREAAAKPADYYRHTRKEMLPFFPASVAKVLDIGCGNGRFGELLKVSFPGVQVWGVEPVAEAHAVAASVLDRALLGGFDASMALPENFFDVIVFNDSLEHFPDHVPVLQLAVRLLKPGGAIVASIPNIRYWPHVQQYLFEADWRYESQGVLDRTHLRFFTRRSILRDFAAAGLDVQQIGGINGCWLSWKFRLLRALMPGLMNDMPYQQFALRAVKPMGLQ
ncbi:class I SAM-dependent methyltransferase [Roseateles microcysteis]|uniref:class I SAM-dependent methyltransferase n=1 Tax=Roseateles microcysteis TaxID=3119057 RepID=UPI002FE60247